MNLLLLFPDDFVAPDTVRLRGRRAEHLTRVHRATVGEERVVGVAGGRVGRGRVVALSADEVELEITLDGDPPPPLPVTLILALPRPKVLNRVVAAATSLGVKRIMLINAWRVEKSYWSSPRASEENLRLQAILGLEQARDTILPIIEKKRFFRPFVEEELPALIRGMRALAAHPGPTDALPQNVAEPTALAIGPEGGFIAEEIDSLRRIGFEIVTLGPRILRVETAVAVALATLGLNAG